MPPFPAAGLLDDFARADGSVGADWTADPFHASGTLPTIESGAAKRQGAYNECWYSAQGFGPNAEAYLDLAVAPTGGGAVYLGIVREPSASSSTADAYQIEARADGRFRLFRYDNTSFSVLATVSSAAALSDGDAVGIRVNSDDGIVSFYHRYGGVWHTISEESDATYFSTGDTTYVEFALVEDVSRIAAVYGGDTSVPNPTVEITLDTTAPSVEWGTPSGTSAGDSFSVDYTMSEALSPPAVLQGATLTLAGGAVLTLADNGSTLSVALPPDAAGGNATVAATVADQIGNVAVRTLVVYIDGTIVVPVEPLPRTPSSPPGRVREYVVVRSRSACGLAGRGRVHATCRPDTTRVRLRARESIRRESIRRHLSSFGSFRVVASEHFSGRQATTSRTRLSGASRVGRRSEGPTTEATLLDLDLI